MRRLGRATDRDISSLNSASSPATIQQNEGHYIAENACQAVAFSAQLVASTAGDTHRLALCFGLCGGAKLAARTGLACHRYPSGLRNQFSYRSAERNHEQIRDVAAPPATTRF
jgi:hypothetical protein